MAESAYIRGKVDAERYYVTRSDRNAVVTCRLKHHLRLLPSIDTARRELKQYPNARYLANSISRTVGYYTFEEALARVLLWMQWRSRWVFGTHVEDPTPHNFPLRVSTSNISPFGAAEVQSFEENDG